jgi:hypothetical protein
VHRLALALGKTVAEIRATMTVAELLDWQRFDGESPLPDRRLDLHMAVQTSSLLNAWVKRADGKHFTTADFMLFDRKPEGPPPPVAGRLLDAFRSYNTALGAGTT